MRLYRARQAFQVAYQEEMKEQSAERNDFLNFDGGGSDE
jgi:hypothetical protein